MLRNTMAVGPLEPVASWVTGWTGVARYRLWEAIWGSANRCKLAWEMPLQRPVDLRKAIAIEFALT
jgi:hypothetical protein